MSPEMAMGLAALVIFLIGGFVGYLFGKGRIPIRTRLLEKKITEAQSFLDYYKDGAEGEAGKLVNRIKKYLD